MRSSLRTTDADAANVAAAARTKPLLRRWQGAAGTTRACTAAANTSAADACDAACTSAVHLSPHHLVLRLRGMPAAAKRGIVQPAKPVAE